MASIAAHVAGARQRLRDAGIPHDEADLDARLLAEHVLGWTTERYFTSELEPATPEFVRAYEPLVARRAAREPLAYLVGRQEFWALTFEVSPAVLIPRPETELIVEAALDLLPRDRRVHAADVCTGSGCLAVAIAHERPATRFVGTDISAAALGTARRNAARHHVGGRVSFVRTDLLAGVRGPFDLIVANPPYVRETERPILQPEVRDYEPSMALFSGRDGLRVITRLVGEAADRLNAGGAFLFEFGYGQDEAVEELVAATPGLRLADVRRDLQGIARVIVATRR